MSTSAGTKVTKDPEAYRNPKNENPGVVTSDSLGAESIKSGGSFAANSDARGPMDQPSRSTNTNNTDTSGARELPPAPDAEARQAQEGWSESSALNSGGQFGNVAGGSGYNTASGGGSNGGSGSGSGNSGSNENDRPAGSGQAAPAPSYYSHPAPAFKPTKPKGKNLQEGGFDGNEPNASFTTEVGTEDDPGRAALGKFEARDVPPAAAGYTGPRQEQVSKDGQYDALDETNA